MDESRLVGEQCVVVANYELVVSATEFNTESCCDRITIYSSGGSESFSGGYL